MSSDESTSEGNTNINVSKKTVKTILGCFIKQPKKEDRIDFKTGIPFKNLKECFSLQEKITS